LLQDMTTTICGNTWHICSRWH